jgi:hypothetical protein
MMDDGLSLTVQGGQGDLGGCCGHGGRADLDGVDGLRAAAAAGMLLLTVAQGRGGGGD